MTARIKEATGRRRLGGRDLGHLSVTSTERAFLPADQEESVPGYDDCPGEAQAFADITGADDP